MLEILTLLPVSGFGSKVREGSMDQLLVKSKTLRVDKKIVESSKDAHNYVAVDLNDIPTQTPLSFTVYYLIMSDRETGTAEFPPLIKAGSQLTGEFKKFLQQRDVTKVFIHKEEFNLFLKRSAIRLKELVTNPYLKASKKNEILYRNATYVIKSIFSDPKVGENFKHAISIVEIYSNFISMSEDIHPSLLIQIFAKDYNLFAHSVQVAILAISFAKILGKTQEEIFQLGLGGLLHDIGKLKISEEILNKPGPLTKEEFELMKSHPIYGKEILDKQTSLLPKESIIITLEHHESADGNGYPGKKTLEDTHPLAQIIHIVDCYDALTMNRVYRSALSPFEALKTMCNEMKSSFNLKLLENFIMFLGY